VSDSPEKLHLAARRLVELESVLSKLRETRESAIQDVNKCLDTYELTYSGRRELRRDLNECEWSVYQYCSLLHMLGEIVARTHTEFGTRLEGYSEVKHEVPKLMGIRHCIHHNGLIGANIATVPSFPDPILVMPLSSIRRHGSWGNGKPAFQTFFHGVSGDAVVVLSVLKNSAEPVEGIVADLISELEEMYDDEQLAKAATNIQLYD